MKKRAWCWLIVPIAAALTSAGIILVPALRAYFHLRHMYQGTGMLALGNFAIPANHLLRMSLDMSAIQADPTITLLNAPGHLLYSLIATSLGHQANWYPETLGPFFWRALILPLCAFPVWLFVGRGIDGSLAGVQLRRIDLILSLCLFAIFLGLSALLRFGITAEERAVGNRTVSYMYGFASWAVLIVIPAVVWMKQRIRARSKQT